MGNVATTRRKSVSKELEKYCKPTGLYETCPWEERIVRRWIMDGQVAPRFPGKDTPGYVNVQNTGTDTGGSRSASSLMQAAGAGTVMGRLDAPSGTINTEECPICFMHYQGVNRTTCCSKPLCTECYLQVKPPRSSVVCPFCNCVKFAVVYVGPPSKEEIARRMADEQRTIEARIHAEQEELVRQMQERNARATSDPVGALSQGQSSADSENSPRAERGSTSAVPNTQPSPPRSAHESSAPRRASIATVAERRLTEEQIRQQMVPRVPNAAGVPGFATETPVPGQSMDQVLRYAASWQRRHSRERSARHARRTPYPDRGSGSNVEAQEEEEDVAVGGPGEIQQVEDLMLMEALRLSVLEEQARRERSGDMMRRHAAEEAAASSSAGATSSWSSGDNPLFGQGGSQADPSTERSTSGSPTNALLEMPQDIEGSGTGTGAGSGINAGTRNGAEIGTGVAAWAGAAGTGPGVGAGTESRTGTNLGNPTIGSNPTGNDFFAAGGIPGWWESGFGGGRNDAPEDRAAGTSSVGTGPGNPENTQRITSSNAGVGTEVLSRNIAGFPGLAGTITSTGTHPAQLHAPASGIAQSITACDSGTDRADDAAGASATSAAEIPADVSSLAAMGYTGDLPESEDEQLMLAIFLSLRSGTEQMGSERSSGSSASTSPPPLMAGAGAAGSTNAGSSGRTNLLDNLLGDDTGSTAGAASTSTPASREAGMASAAASGNSTSAEGIMDWLMNEGHRRDNKNSVPLSKPPAPRGHNGSIADQDYRKPTTQENLSANTLEESATARASGNSMVDEVDAADAPEAVCASRHASPSVDERKPSSRPVASHSVLTSNSGLPANVSSQHTNTADWPWTGSQSTPSWDTPSSSSSVWEEAKSASACLRPSASEPPAAIQERSEAVVIERVLTDTFDRDSSSNIADRLPTRDVIGLPNVGDLSVAIISEGQSCEAVSGPVDGENGTSASATIENLHQTEEVRMDTSGDQERIDPKSSLESEEQSTPAPNALRDEPDSFDCSEAAGATQGVGRLAETESGPPAAENIVDK